jgi:hypothetical protein
MIDDTAYINRRLYKITGFLHPVDAMVLLGLSLFQKSHGITGSIAEIGVFYGRSFCLLVRTLVRGKEKALAIDLFDIGVRDGRDSEQLESFKRTLATEGVPDSDYLIRAGSSGEVTADYIVGNVGRVRLFSVDGGHEKEEVDYDSALALQALHPNGVIAFDDFFNPQYPDVTCAVIDFLRANSGQITPFCLTKNKLYVCPSSAYDTYTRCMSELPLWAGATKAVFPFLGKNVHFCTQSIPNRIAYQKAAEIGFGDIADKLLRKSRQVYAR